MIILYLFDSSDRKIMESILNEYMSTVLAISKDGTHVHEKRIESLFNSLNKGQKSLKKYRQQIEDFQSKLLEMKCDCSSSHKSALLYMARLLLLF